MMLVVSYLFVIKLWERADTEPYGKGHLPINVKTPFAQIFNDILTPTERMVYEELIAGPMVRYRLFGTVEDSPTLALGANKLFPSPVGSSITWDDVVDWSLGDASKMAGLPGGGTVWPASDTAPLVALELRRIGFTGLDSSKWGKLINTVVALTQALNA